MKLYYSFGEEDSYPYEIDEYYDVKSFLESCSIEEKQNILKEYAEEWDEISWEDLLAEVNEEGIDMNDDEDLVELALSLGELPLFLESMEEFYDYFEDDAREQYRDEWLSRENSLYYNGVDEEDFL